MTTVIIHEEVSYCNVCPWVDNIGNIGWSDVRCNKTGNILSRPEDFKDKDKDIFIDNEDVWNIEIPDNCPYNK